MGLSRVDSLSFVVEKMIRFLQHLKMMQFADEGVGNQPQP